MTGGCSLPGCGRLPRLSAGAGGVKSAGGEAARLAPGMRGGSGTGPGAELGSALPDGAMSGWFAGAAPGCGANWLRGSGWALQFGASAGAGCGVTGPLPPDGSGDQGGGWKSPAAGAGVQAGAGCGAGCGAACGAQGGVAAPPALGWAVQSVEAEWPLTGG